MSRHLQHRYTPISVLGGLEVENCGLFIDAEFRNILFQFYFSDLPYLPKLCSHNSGELLSSRRARFNGNPFLRIASVHFPLEFSKEPSSLYESLFYWLINLQLILSVVEMYRHCPAVTFLWGGRGVSQIHFNRR